MKFSGMEAVVRKRRSCDSALCHTSGEQQLRNADVAHASALCFMSGCMPGMIALHCCNDRDAE